MKSLDEKVVASTGAGSGMGRAYAGRLGGVGTKIKRLQASQALHSRQS